MPVCLLGIGTARPAHAMDQRHAAELAVEYCGRGTREARLLPEIFRKTHVQRRGSVLLRPASDERITDASMSWFYHAPGCGDVNGESSPRTTDRMEQFRRHAPPLAADAAAAALRRSRVAPDTITHLVIVTCTGFASPGVDYELITRLGLRRTVQRTQVGFMGCHGVLNGMQVAAAFAAAQPGARVLLVSVELCSIHFQYGQDTQRLVANALFADGAAAAVVGSGGDEQAWRVAGSASCLLEDGREDMTWHIGDHGFEMTLSARVPGIISDGVRPWIDEFLGGHGMKVADVATWAVHAGGPRIVGAVAQRLGLGDDDVETSRSVLRDCGNMSSATLLFILDRLRERGTRPPCVMLGFGPGLVAEAVLLT